MFSLEKLTSRHNPKVERWKKLGSSRGYRREEKSIIIEGKNLVLDILASSHKKYVKAVILSDESIKKYRPATPSVPHYLLSDSLFRMISTVENPEGFMIEIALSSFESTLEDYLAQAVVEDSKRKRILVLDSLQDPGNVGTLMRSAALFSIDALLLIEPVCDLWNPKVIRSAKGAHFQLKIISSSWKEVEKSMTLLPPLYVTYPPGDGVIPINRLEPKDIGTTGWTLVLGNEGQGVSIPKEMPSTKITIPTNNSIESLNVAQAGAICLYALSIIRKE